MINGEEFECFGTTKAPNTWPPTRTMEYYYNRNIDRLKYSKDLDDIINKNYAEILENDKNANFKDALTNLIKIKDYLETNQGYIKDYYRYNTCISWYYNIIESFPPFDDNGVKLWQYSFEMKDWIDNKINEEHRGEEEKQGGKRKSKSKKNNVSKKPVVSQKKQSEYKEILGKKMKIYKKPDSRKQYVRYKGELHSISDYKNLMKQKATAKATAKSKK
jgi:hypothetical protein